MITAIKTILNWSGLSIEFVQYALEQLPMALLLTQWMKLLDRTSPTPYHVYDFKDAYLSFLQEYKKTRVAMFGNYEIIR